jgi:hypothetical protein
VVRAEDGLKEEEQTEVGHNLVKFKALALEVWREMMTEHAHGGTVVGRQL